MNEATLKPLESKLGTDHPDTLTCRVNLAESYRAAGRTAEAITLLEATLKMLKSKLGADQPNTIICRNNLARAYEDAGRWDEGERLRADVLAVCRTIEKPGSTLLASDLASLGFNLSKQSKWSEAERLLRESLAIREKVIPGEWLRYNAMALLGEALLGQEKFAEAEPLIVGGYEGLKVRAAKIPAQGKSKVSGAAERVVRLYEALGKPEKAEAWKQKLFLADLPADVFARP